jgi:PPOX class probable F420-dependent enzyme
MEFVRRLENRFYGRVRDRRAAEVATGEPGPWDTGRLRGHKYCLLTSYRASGAAVSTPVWFGIEGDRIYIRSGADDGKIKRIRRTATVLVAPCTARGGPLGDPMTGLARILDVGEHAHAEHVLRASYGLGRRIYRLVRRRISVAYVEVSG